MTPEELISLSKRVSFSDRGQREIRSDVAPKMLQFVELLAKWSQKMSLVSSSDPARIVNEHILDSWAAFQFVPRETCYLDIGSGAGLPGIVFAMLAPESKVILLEPRLKRIEFLKEVRRHFSLQNVELAASRLEDWDMEIEKVSAMERAVGMEKELYDILQTKTPQFTLSVLVGDSWENPLRGINHTVDSYKLANGVGHQVICFT